MTSLPETSNRKRDSQLRRAASTLLVCVVVVIASAFDPRSAAAICADRIVSDDEQCDDGGVCSGGPQAGMDCSAEADCIAGGACFGGLDDLRVCASDDDCRQGACRRCRPVGGDGCAANCTFESKIPVALVAGIVDVDPYGIVEGTSGAVIFGPFIVAPLPFTGGITLSVGQALERVSPIAIKTSDIDLGPIPLGALACACIGSATQFTCGGTLLEADGRFSADCTPGFSSAVECAEETPCAALHGVGNSASGFIGCGMPAVDLEVNQDCNAKPGAAPFPAGMSSVQASTPGAEGNALLPFAIVLNTVVGACSGTTPEYGPDGRFCTSDDPITYTHFPFPVVFTTGSSSGTVFNAGDSQDEALHATADHGRPFLCGGADGSADLRYGVISGVLTGCDLPTVDDIVAPFSFAFEAIPPTRTPTVTPTPLPSPGQRPGDCDNSTDVTVNELTVLVTVALSQESVDRCSAGDIDHDGRITVDEIVIALGRALDGCYAAGVDRD